MKDLDSEEFYGLMQEYRHAPISPQKDVVKAFEAVKDYIRSAEPRPCQHCGLLPHPTITESVCVNLPGRPVSGMCVLNGCQAHDAAEPRQQVKRINANDRAIASWQAELEATEPRPPAAAVDLLDLADWLEMLHKRLSRNRETADLYMQEMTGLQMWQRELRAALAAPREDQ